MRVGFIYDAVYPYVSGGVEKRIWELATRLATEGTEVHLFGVKYWPGPDISVEDGVIRHGVCKATDLYTKTGRRSILQGLRFAAAVRGSLRGQPLDLIDCQSASPLSCLSAWWFARRNRIPLVITWHEVWDDYWMAYLGPLGRLGRLIESWCARLGQHHLAVSHHTAARVRTILGVESVRVVPNGTNTSLARRISPGERSSDLVFVGRLVRQKNLGLLIEAMVELRRRDLTPRLLIAGEGPERQWLAERIGRLGLNTVEIVPDLDSEEEVLAHMKASRVFVLPSTHEGFSLTALEALACGLPVVAVQAPGNAAGEVVGRAGLLTENDPIAFADALERLLTDEPARRELGVEASRRAADSDWDAVVAELRSAYSGIVASEKA